jgi:hypothetical protein
VNANSQRSSKISRRTVAYVVPVLFFLVVNAASAAPEDEVRATFDRFVSVQNARDANALDSL